MAKNLFLEQSPCYHPNVYEMGIDYKFSSDDIAVLRALGKKVQEIAARDDMKAKRVLWADQNDLKTTQPIVYTDPECGWNEIFPISSLQCQHELARTWEMTLKKQIYCADVIKDDHVVEAFIDIPYVYTDSGWGLEIKKHGGENNGAFIIENVLGDYDEAFEKLHFPEIDIDLAQSTKLMDLANEVFNGILGIRRHHNWHWDLSFVEKFVLLRGMEDFMCDFIAEPENITRMMTFLIDGMEKRLDYMEEKGLLNSNNDSSYIGTGGQGWTNELPESLPNKPVKTIDMWGAVQAQETVSVSPDMFGELILPHQIRILKRFGKTCYGCCEPFDPRWKYIKQLPNLRRVSVSPWADYAKAPEYLGKNYVAQVKLKPTPLASPIMNEEIIRKECKEAVEKTMGCICEFIMKDNHTLGNNPQNIVRWAQIMREEIDRAYNK